MSEQIVLPGFSGDVVLVNGLCYEFAGYTEQPPEDLEVTALFDTCEECGPILGSSESSGFSSSIPSASEASGVEEPPGEEEPPGVEESSAAAEISSTTVPTVTCNGCVHPQEYIVTFGGLADTEWEWANGATTVYESSCSWGIHFAGGKSIFLAYIVGTSTWQASVTNAPGGIVYWEGPSDLCDPVDDYGTHVLCVFSTDCATLGMTTCNVSAPPGF